VWIGDNINMDLNHEHGKRAWGYTKWEFPERKDYQLLKNSALSYLVRNCTVWYGSVQYTSYSPKVYALLPM
jgi:hypothetical protein